MAIALLTDFGTSDYFVAAMKGAILSINPAATIVDITHEVPPQDIEYAAFTLEACFRDFPAKTVFVVVVDPGVGSERRAIIVEASDRFFLAPDNGVLGFLFRENAKTTNGPARVFEVTESRFFAKDVSGTFHGRDIFAPVAAHLSLGVLSEGFGPEVRDPMRLELPVPVRLSESEFAGEVIHVDRFGNLITNFTTHDLPSKFSFALNGAVIDRHLEFYAAAMRGEVFSIIGSAGYVEISAFLDSAATILNAGVGDRVMLKQMPKAQ